MWLFFLALLAGALLPLAFAPIDFYALAFFMPALLLFIWLQVTARRAFWMGLLSGIGCFTVGSSWIYISVHNFGNANALLAGTMTALLILLMSLYPAVQGYFIQKIATRQSDALVCLAAFPASTVLLEYLRSFLFDGFPFLFLGYSQTNTLLNGLAPIIGVYGLSLIIALISGSLVLCLRRQVPSSSKAIGAVVILGCIGAGIGLHHHRWTQPNSQPIVMSLVQGNIPQQMKWDPHALQSILERYQTLTQQHWTSRIIVWPEAAIPFLPNQLPRFFNNLDTEAKQHRSTLVVGAPLMDAITQQYYNGLLLVGSHHGSYRKRHLVPFGEFIPLQNIFGPLMRKLNVPMAGLSPGPSQQPDLSIEGIPIAFFICYETAFPIETLREMQGKELAINIVDDAWFGHSFAAAQQLQMTQMRAQETGRYIAVTANTGITALIDPLGNITQRLPIDTTGVLTVSATAQIGDTPLMRLHYYPVGILVGALLLISLFWKKHRANKKTTSF